MNAECKVEEVVEVEVRNKRSILWLLAVGPFAELVSRLQARSIDSNLLCSLLNFIGASSLIDSNWNSSKTCLNSSAFSERIFLEIQSVDFRECLLPCQKENKKKHHQQQQQLQKYLKSFRHSRLSWAKTRPEYSSTFASPPRLFIDCS